MTNSVLAKLAVVISANTAEFTRSINATRNELQAFTGGVTKLASSLGLAFGVQQVASFALEVSKLSGEAKGVSAAFERLPNSTKLLEDMKDATGDTVSELDLMKRAVQANNFEISLAALPRLLEFATLRAQQTGQSVDYLVDSIVTGIGRKSKLILDNLGISAVQLNEALGGASTAASSIGEVADAVGKIAEANLKNMAGFSDNASTRLDMLAASWVNVKVAIGDAANSTGILGTALSVLGDQLNILASSNIPNYLKALNLMTLGSLSGQLAQLDAVKTQIKINAEQKKQEQIIREVDRAYKEFNKDIDAYGKAISTHIYKTELLAEFTKRLTAETGEEIESYAQLKNQLDELNQQFEVETKRNDLEALALIGKKIILTKEQIATLDKLRNAEKKKDPLAGKFQFLPDMEAEGSTNSELRNEQAVVEAKEFSAALDQVAVSAEFAGGALIQLEDTNATLTETMKETWEELSGVVVGALSGIGHALGSAISGSMSFGDALLGVLGGVLVQLGEMLIAAGVGVEAFKESLKSLNGFVAIGAGIALVALGSAIAGSIRGLGSSGGGGSGSPGFSGGGNSWMASTSLQDSAPKLVTVIKGQDLWVMLANYQRGNIHTRAVG